jgi:hypothetical protein
MHRMTYKDYQVMVEVERLKERAWLDILNKVRSSFFILAGQSGSLSV